MMERLNYGTGRTDDDDKEEHGDGYRPSWHSEDLEKEYEYKGDDYEGDGASVDDVLKAQDQVDHQVDDNGVVDFLDVDDPVDHQVDHAVDHAAEDTVETDFDVRYIWRGKRRHTKRGRIVPPDTRKFNTPVFVRVADL